jgi:addiction module HigA family antidote
MAAAKKSEFSSARADWRDMSRCPTHPGVYVKEIILGKHGLTQGELAEALGLSRLSVNEIVGAKRSITESTALRLGKLTGTTPETWLDLQRNYTLWHTFRAEKKMIDAIAPLRASTGKRQNF